LSPTGVLGRSLLSRGAILRHVPDLADDVGVELVEFLRRNPVLHQFSSARRPGFAAIEE
jgi:hypothetical protein